MRTLIALLSIAAATPALADATCEEIAGGFRAMHADFPDLIAGSPERLVTWRASCAEDPPDGAGKVVELCQADTATGGVFYWVKVRDNGGSSGFAICG